MLTKTIWEERGLYIQYEGMLSQSDMLNSDKNYGDARFDDINYILINMLLSTGFNFNQDKVEIKAAQSNAASVWNNHIKLIFVVINEDIKKALQFYVEQMKQGENNWEVFIVATIQEARELIAKDDKVTFN